MAINEERLHEFMGRAVGDMGATMAAALVVIGEKRGLYKAMGDSRPVTAAELAARSENDERYVREWLAGQAAGGYIAYDPATKTYRLPEEQALVLAREDGPVHLPSAFALALSVLKDEPVITEAFKTGRGVGWHEHDPGLYVGTEKFFRPGYQMNLTSNWIPALDGVEARLKAGAKVADVGCGHGASTILMAKAYPKSTFHGFDYHEKSIETARRRARDAGVEDRVTFDTAPAKSYPGRDYDLVGVFDCLHDMGDPVGAATHIRQTLAPHGTWMIVEPYAGDHLEENLNPVGRVFYCASTLICTPASKAQEVGLALGAQAGEANLRRVVTEGGFTRFRRATETPFNLIFEARP